MPSTKELKQRIKGIKSTSKITRAMEMISAVKMRKAVMKTLAIRPYVAQLSEIFEHLSGIIDIEQHSFFRHRPVANVLLVVMTSNRGLCGSFNAQVMRAVKRYSEAYCATHPQVRAIDFVSIGKKGDAMLRRFDGTIKASFPGLTSPSRMDDMRALSRLVCDEFASGHYDKVVLVYTEYISPLAQQTHERRLLPLSQEALHDEMKEMQHSNRMMYEEESVGANPRIRPNENIATQNNNAQYVIEPSPQAVLDTLAPRLVETQLYHAALESDASQEAARMMAMRNATDAAKDMVADFTLAYNQLRQAKVTQEIAELSAGMAAVSG